LSIDYRLNWTTKLVDLNYNFECDWLIELSDSSACELVEIGVFQTNHNQGNCNFCDSWEKI